MQEKERSLSSRLAMRHPLFFLLPLVCAGVMLAVASVLEGKKSGKSCL